MAKKPNKVSRLEVATSHTMEGFLNQLVEDDTWLKCWVCCRYIPSCRKLCLMLLFGHFVQGVVMFSENMTCTSLSYLMSYVTGFASCVIQLF